MNEKIDIPKTLELSGPKVLEWFSLQENKNLYNENEKKYIFKTLMHRDFPKQYKTYLSNYINIYIDNLLIFGQPYTVNISYDLKLFESVANLPVLNEKYIKTNEDEITIWPDKLTFYLGPKLDGKETIASDYNKGSQYWISGMWPNSFAMISISKSLKREISNVMDDINFSDDIEDFEKKEIKVSFPNDYDKIKPGSVYRDVVKILKTKGQIFFKSQQLINDQHTYFVKNIILV